MATIQELIDRGEAVLGETTLRITGTDFRFKPLGKDRYEGGRLKWFGVYPDGRLDWRTTTYDNWEVWVEPPPMEDRWLWATDAGLVTSLMRSKPPRDKTFHIKLEWSRTSFPKDDTSD